MAVTKERNLVREVLAISRFNTPSPIFTTFAGVWNTLLSGAVVIGKKQGDISPAFVFKQTGLCLLTLYLFCGAGNAWNDWVDRHIDARVARTKNRPLAKGIVTTPEIMVWITSLIASSFVVMAAMLNGQDVLKHFLPMLASTLLYPYGKRPFAKTLRVYPQYLLGFAVAWPAIPARAAIYGRYESFSTSAVQCLPLCVMIFFWIIYQNTAYSYQDVEDDIKLKVNSLYLIAVDRIRLLLWLLVAPVVVCLPIFLTSYHSTWLWCSWMGVWMVTLIRQLAQFNPEKPESGGYIHKANLHVGIWTIFACSVEVFLQSRL